ncbi:MAG: hypothetical protein AAF514_14415, partial [Verrucomicrobiota bacterium]
GFRALNKLVDTGSIDVRVRALRLLARHPLTNSRDAEAYAGRLVRESNADPNSRLPAERLLYDVLVSDASKRRIVDRVCHQFRDAAPHDLAEWLLAIGDFSGVLELIDEQAAFADRDLFLVYTNALMQAARFSDLDRLLRSDHSLPIEDLVRELIWVERFDREGNVAVRDVHWRRVVHRLESRDKVELIRVAQWAESRLYHHMALDIYDRLLQVFPSFVDHWYDAQLRLCKAAGEFDRLHRLTKNLSTSYPRNKIYQYNHAYLMAVAGEELPEAREVLSGLLEDKPDLIEARCALALVAYREGQVDQARGLVEALDRGQLSPENQLIVHLVEERKVSDRLLEQLDLFPEEARLFFPQRS